MEQKQDRPNKKPYYFTAYPNALLYGRILNRDEKFILHFIIAAGDKGCCYSLQKWWELTGFGDYHIRRALARLTVLKLVDVAYGRRTGKGSQTRYESHHYTFRTDPFSWKLTKEMCSRISDEAVALGFPAKAFQHEPFPNRQGFEIVFSHIFPNFSRGRKGRSAKIVYDETDQEFNLDGGGGVEVYQKRRTIGDRCTTSAGIRAAILAAG